MSVILNCQRAAALAGHLDLEPDDVEPVTWDDDGFTWEAESAEYLVLTDDEADERVLEQVRESLWAFNADFLAAYMPEGLGSDEIEAIRGDRCEDANPAFLALVGDQLEELAEDAAGCDGRGHFLAGYDGHEWEHEHGGISWYVYRVN